MRSEEDVQHVFDHFDEAEGCELRRTEGDNFKFGFYAGKVAALAWVLGDPIEFVKIHHDFESWKAEKGMNKGKIPPLGD